MKQKNTDVKDAMIGGGTSVLLQRLFELPWIQIPFMVFLLVLSLGKLGKGEVSKKMRLRRNTKKSLR